MKLEYIKYGVVCLLDNTKPYVILGIDYFKKDEDVIIMDENMRSINVHHSRLS